MKAEGVLNILSKVTLKCQKQDLKPVRLASVSHIFHHFSKLSLVEIVGDGAFPRKFRTCMKCRVLKREKRALRQKGVVAAKQNTLECFNHQQVKLSDQKMGTITIT